MLCSGIIVETDGGFDESRRSVRSSQKWRVHSLMEFASFLPSLLQLGLEETEVRSLGV